MPKKKFSKDARESLFSGLIQDHITDSTNILDALEFIESPQGLSIQLYPVQRVLIKLIFGIPMDKDEREVPIYDTFCDNLLYTLKETDYIKYVHDQGRINLSSWQDASPEGYNETVAIVGRRGGKALAIDTPIPTPDGFVNIGDLKTGDYVFSPNGTPVKIIQAHTPFIDQTYRVSFDDKTSVVCHGGHLWHTLTQKERKNNARHWPKTGPRPQMCKESSLGSVKTTLEIKDSLFYARSDGKKETNHSINLTQPVIYPEQPLPLDPYFFGIWLGDGHSDTVSITTMDEEIKNYVYQIAKEYKLEVTVSSNGSKASDYSITSQLHGSIKGEWGNNPNRNILLNKLKEMKVIRNKHIPEIYLKSSVDQRLALLQGLMDTDGGCHRSRCEFNNTNENIAKGVFSLAASLGLKPYWNEKRATIYGKDCGPCYRVTWTAPTPVFRLPRKLAELQIKSKPCQNRRFITSIEPERVQEVRCITVNNPDGLFLFGYNFNITHNSALVSAIASYKLYRLLNIRSPQDYYGLIPGSPIDFTFMAQDTEGSSRLFDKMKEDVNRAPFFAPYLKNMTTEEMTFVSDADRHKRDITPSITVASLPCLEENELIWTSKGLTPIKDVAVGDSVFDMHGDLKKVLNKTNNEEKLLAISTRNFKGDPLLLTPQHTCISVSNKEAFEKLPYLYKWNLGGKGLRDCLNNAKRDDSKELDIKLTEDYANKLEEGDYFLFPQISLAQRTAAPLDNSLAKSPPFYQKHLGGKICEHSSVRCRTVAELPITMNACRLYGLYLAEGSTMGKVGKLKNSVKWTFHIDEKDSYAKFIEQTLLSEFGLNSSTILSPAQNKCDVYCSSSELTRGLEHWFGAGCGNKVIPNEALYWPVELQKALLQGYYEGDGSDNRRIAPTVSKKLAYSLFNLIIQTGQRPSVLFRPGYTTVYKQKEVVHRDSWYIEICKQDNHCRFFQKVKGVNYYWSKITSIVPVKEKHRVVDIEVEDTHSFLTKYAAVHNCTTNKVRGPSSFLLALDEFAFYRNQIGVNSEAIYKAAAPATMQFKAGGTRDGKRESMILIITSPNGKIGKYYELYSSAMKMGNSSDILAFRCSTAEMNPRSDVDFLRKEHRENPDVFKAEYGGEFLEAAESYVRLATFESCIDESRRNVTQFTPELVGHKYFWGLDLGMQHDATALSVCHWEPAMTNLTAGATLVYDYIDRLMVGEGKYENVKQLPLEDVLAWLQQVNQLLPCHKGATDQHGGSMLVQLLEKYNINGLDLVHLTTGINSQMYLILKGLMEQRKTSFPKEEKFIAEMKLVEAFYIGKYQIKVQAPAEKDAHDDQADSTALASWVAQQWSLNEGSREFADILNGMNPALLVRNHGLVGNFDPNLMSMAELKTYERQLGMNQRYNPGVVINPFRRR